MKNWKQAESDWERNPFVQVTYVQSKQLSSTLFGFSGPNCSVSAHSRCRCWNFRQGQDKMELEKIENTNLSLTFGPWGPAGGWVQTADVLHVLSSTEHYAERAAAMSRLLEKFGGVCGVPALTRCESTKPGEHWTTLHWSGLRYVRKLCLVLVKSSVLSEYPSDCRCQIARCGSSRVSGSRWFEVARDSTGEKLWRIVVCAFNVFALECYFPHAKSCQGTKSSQFLLRGRIACTRQQCARAFEERLACRDKVN